MYRRYLKQMVGWKRAMEVQLNQRCLIEKLQKVADHDDLYDPDDDHYDDRRNNNYGSLALPTMFHQETAKGC